MSTVIGILAGLVLLSGSGFSWAQAPQGNPAGDDKSSPVFEVGLQVGRLLPNQIDGVTEIMGLGGVLMAMRMNPGSYLEGGILMGNGEGQEWKNIFAGARMDIPVENLLAFASIGADNYYYKGRGTGQKLAFGGHAGGGVMAHLTGNTWFRGDMKFSFNPGTSLYFGFGFQWRF